MIDVSTGKVEKNTLYSVRLNMDTASKKRIDDANEKLRDTLRHQGEFLAADRVDWLINHQHVKELKLQYYNLF